MSVLGVDPEKLVFARAEMPDGLATFDVAGPNLVQDMGEFIGHSRLGVLVAIEAFIQSQPHIDLPLPSSMTQDLGNINIRPFAEEELGLLRKVVFNWPCFGGMRLALRSMTTPDLVVRSRPHPMDVSPRQSLAAVLLPSQPVPDRKVA